jgi:hypothetical protein
MPLTASGNKSSSSISIFPNPTSNVLFIKDARLYSEYVIVSVSGQIIHKGRITGSNIDVRALPTGTYILRLTDPNRVVYSKSFIKN